MTTPNPPQVPLAPTPSSLPPSPLAPPSSPLTFAITGPTGLVGRRTADLLKSSGHLVLPVRRLAPNLSFPTHEATWKPDTGEISFPTHTDILIHLAGKNIATRWSAGAKREIWNSRVTATEKLCQYLARIPSSRRPRLLISASAIGIYGSRGDEVLTEDSTLAPPSSSFLAGVCRAWEAATKPAQDAGIQVVIPRIGVVLSPDGGALAKLRTPTRLGLAGPVGPATQFLPWISLTDLSRLLLHFALTPDLTGPVNAVAPSPGSPTRQHEFIRTLAKVLHRPAFFPLPSFMVKLLFGQMGSETLLASSRVIPTRIPRDFNFLHATLESALRAELQLP